MSGVRMMHLQKTGEKSFKSTNTILNLHDNALKKGVKNI